MTDTLDGADRLDQLRRGKAPAPTPTTHVPDRPYDVAAWCDHMEALRGSKMFKLIEFDLLDYIKALEATHAPERTSKSAEWLREAADIITRLLFVGEFAHMGDDTDTDRARAWLKRVGLDGEK